MSSIVEQIAKLNVNYESLFKEVKFCLIECSHPDEHDVKTLLQNGGAKQISYMSDMVTHVISDTDDNSDISEAREIFEKPVVTCSWVIMSIKCNVLLPVEGFAPESKQLFSGVVACPSQLSKKDCHCLWALLTYNGGNLKLKFDRSCTHVVVTLPQGRKYEKALADSVKVVTPDWVMDSVKNKERCDEESYHPGLLILPKTPTPSPPPAPPVPETPPPPAVQERIVQSVAEQISQPSSAPVFAPSQALPAAPRTAQQVPTVMTTESGLAAQQALAWQQQRMQRPQLSTAQQQIQQQPVSSSVMVAGNTRPPGMTWQQRPQQTVITSSAASSTSPRAASWQQQLLAQGRLTPQQQMILQQKWLHQQQQQQQAAARMGIPQQRLASNPQQGPVVLQQQQQRMQLQNSQHALMTRPGVAQQLQMSQQQQINQRRLTSPNQQVVQNQQIQLVQQKPQVMGAQMQQQRLQMAQQIRPIVSQQQGGGAPAANVDQQKTVQVQRHPQPQQLRGPQPQLRGQQPLTPQQLRGQLRGQQVLTPQQQQQLRGQQSLTPQQQQQLRGQAQQIRGQQPMTPQQQLLWQQQQQQRATLGGRVIVSQGVRQGQPVQYDAQSQAQLIRMQQQQQAMWQQRRQMLLANQQQQQQKQQLPSSSAASTPGTVGARMQLATAPQQIPQQQQQQQPRIVQQSIPAHPPPPYPGKSSQAEATTTQVPSEPLASQQQQQTVPQITVGVTQQQLVNSAGQIVTPKTKTALANLLNTRLQTGTISPNQKEFNVTDSAQAQVNRQATTVRVDAARKKDQGTIGEGAVVMKPTIQLYGHDPELRIIPSSCLIGCNFLIADYESPLNKVEMWKKVIKYYGGEVESKYSSACTHIICESTKNPIMQQALRESKRCVTAFWLNDVIVQKNMIPPWKALHIPSPCIHDRPCRQHMITISGFEGNDRKCLKEMIQIAGAKYTGHLSRLNTVLISKKNEGLKFEKAVEWRIPVVNVQWLNDILFGHYEALKCINAAKYQNYSLENTFKVDYSNIHHLMFAWRSPVRVSESLLAKCVERPPLRTLNTLNDQTEKPLEPPSKRIKLSGEECDSAKPRVMFSGISDTSELVKIVEKLGGSIALTAKDCTHLVIKSVIRTVKVLCCISTCEFILAVDWLHESNRQNKFVEEPNYIPNDPELESTIGCNLSKTLLRKERTLIFQDFTFYVTPTVPPSYKLLCLIIESGGGKVAKKPPKISELQALNKGSIRFIIVSCDADMHLCRKFFANDISVYNPEVVLTSLMNQHVDLSIFKYKADISGQRVL